MDTYNNFVNYKKLIYYTINIVLLINKQSLIRYNLLVIGLFVLVGFFTIDAYAAELQIILNDESDVSGFEAIISGSAVGGQQIVQFDSSTISITVNPGSYNINLRTNNAVFNALIENPDECDGNIPTDDTIETCDVSLGQSDGDQQGFEVVGFPDEENITTKESPALFKVTTNISKECQADDSCNHILANNVLADICTFYLNYYNCIKDIPGSENPRHFAFSSSIQNVFFNYPKIPLQIEIMPNDLDFIDRNYRYGDDEGNVIQMQLTNYTAKLNNCSVYLYPGETEDCLIVIKPKNR